MKNASWTMPTGDTKLKKKTGPIDLPSWWCGKE
jgi:hypothetical protein